MAYFHTTVLDNQIKALPTVDTATGAIATFNTDLTENLVDVKCQIVAKQASGTPSPVNPLPITTYTEMNLSHSGKNLFDESYPSIGTLKYMSIFVGNGTFTMSTDLPTRTDTYANLFFLANQVSSGADSASNGVYNNRPVTVTSTDGYVTIAYRYDQYNPRDYHTQIERGSTATTYEPFGTTSNIPFGQTVANGVLDITTGKLRVTWGILNLSDFTWILASSNTSCNRFSTAGVIPLASQNTHNNICSFDAGGWIQGNSITSSATTVNALDIRTTSILVNLRKTIFDGTAEQFNTWVVDKQICYELATPIEIQLDSITLQALLNENNIWCDTGDTEVKFLLTVGKKIS